MTSTGPARCPRPGGPGGLGDQGGALGVGEHGDGPGLQGLRREARAVGGGAGERGPELSGAGRTGVQADAHDRRVGAPVGAVAQLQTVAVRELADRQGWRRHGPEATARGGGEAVLEDRHRLTR